MTYNGGVYTPYANDTTHLTNAVLQGFQSDPFFDATSGTLGSSIAIGANVQNNHAATIGSAFGLLVQAFNSGTITNNYGIDIKAPTQSNGNGVGTITNNYALVTEAGAGNVGIGTTTPGAGLDLASSTIQGAGLSSDCSATTNKLLWSSSTKLFSCGTDTEGEVKKTATTNITSNAVLADDADLKFTAAANTAYSIELTASASATATTPGIRVSVDAPAGSGVAADFHMFQQAGITTGTGCNISQPLQNCPLTFTGAGAYPMTMHGIVQTSGSGTVAIMFAQNASSATSTTIYKDSVLKWAVLGAADLAEIYYTNDNSMEAADVVSIDGSLSAGVKKTTRPYEEGMMGVVSTKPAITIGDLGNGGSPRPIALSGRAPVKVTTENGIIQPGDYLTSSSLPGVAMKATKASSAIGQALTGFSEGGVGTITAFIKSSYYNGESLDNIVANPQATDPHAYDEAILNTFMTQQSDPNATSSASEIFSDRIAAALGIITPTLTVDTIYAHTIKADRIEGLEILTNQISRLDTNYASLSANLSVLGASTSAGIATDSGQSVLPLLQADGLSINNNATVSADLRVKGNGLFEGVLSVIDTLKANDFITTGVSDFFGLVNFRGDVQFMGRPTFNADTAGFAIIKKGSDHVNISFDKAYDQQPVINATLNLSDQISPTGVTNAEEKVFSQGYTYIISRKSGKGFQIVLNKPASEDLEFSWNVTAVSNAKTFQSTENEILPVSITPPSSTSDSTATLSGGLQ